MKPYLESFISNLTMFTYNTRFSETAKYLITTVSFSNKHGTTLNTVSDFFLKLIHLQGIIPMQLAVDGSAYGRFLYCLGTLCNSFNTLGHRLGGSAN